MFQYLLLLETDEEKEFFQNIYRKHKDEMYYIAYEIVKVKSDAEDIVHETFLTLINHLDKLMYNEPHKTWNYMITVVKHKSYNLCKKKRIWKETGLEEWEWEQEQAEVFEKSMEDLIEETEKNRIIMELLGRMKSPYQDVLLMQYYHEMSIQEIAELLEKSTDNVRHISSRAKKKLQIMMEEIGILNE